MTMFWKFCKTKNRIRVPHELTLLPILQPWIEMRSIRKRLSIGCRWRGLVQAQTCRRMHSRFSKMKFPFWTKRRHKELSYEWGARFLDKLSLGCLRHVFLFAWRCLVVRNNIFSFSKRWIADDFDEANPIQNFHCCFLCLGRNLLTGFSCGNICLLCFLNAKELKRIGFFSVQRHLKIVKHGHLFSYSKNWIGLWNVSFRRNFLDTPGFSSKNADVHARALCKTNDECLRTGHHIQGSSPLDLHTIRSSQGPPKAISRYLKAGHLDCIARLLAQGRSPWIGLSVSSDLLGLCSWWGTPEFYSETSCNPSENVRSQ